jgi:hypothetical protein
MRRGRAWARSVTWAGDDEQGRGFSASHELAAGDVQRAVASMVGELAEAGRRLGSMADTCERADAAGQARGARAR